MIYTLNALVKTYNHNYRIRDACWRGPILQGLRRDVYIECPCKDMQSELEIHVCVDLSCSVLDVMCVNSMNAIVKTCNQNLRYMSV